MLKKRGKFICIIGIDGSGKSTQANLMLKNCVNNNLKFSYVYAKNIPILFKPFLMIAHILVLYNLDEKREYFDYKSKKQSVIKKYSILANIYYNILIFDYYIQLFFKITLPLWIGKNIICDRYIYDTIITEIAVDRKYSNEDILKSIQRLSSNCPIPDIIFLIDVPEDVAFNRKTDISSIHYLEERRISYLSLVNVYKMIIIDGTDTIQNIELKMFNIVKTKFGVI